MILALITALLLLNGCENNDYQKCTVVCTSLAVVCSAAAEARPFVPPEQTVESCRMCMESYALCRRSCEVQP
jgi:hypothetical protein